MTRLAEELAALPSELRTRLDERGFSAERLIRFAETMASGRASRNLLTGRVEPPAASDLYDLAAASAQERQRFRERGEQALRAGKVALCVLAGGMATRMGGVVKALVEALPGRTFLDLRLAEQAALGRRYPQPVPLFLMASEATAGPIRAALGGRLDGRTVAVFEQCVSLRLTPTGELFRDERGELSVYASGHGDLPDALRESGLLDAFIAERGADATLWLTNLDNLGATIDAELLGMHLTHGGELSVEVVDKVGTDRGGIPIRHDGHPMIAEEFRLPPTFDPQSVRVFNTNTFIASARALRDLSFEFTFVEVEKTVGAAKAVQFERLLGEITVPLPARFVRVPREGAGSRFLPVKDLDELERRRPEIEAVCRERGILP